MAKKKAAKKSKKKALRKKAPPISTAAAATRKGPAPKGRGMAGRGSRKAVRTSVGGRGGTVGRVRKTGGGYGG